jgi:signal transduction histidine kinase/CheY-like chemotaxis protein
MNDDEIHVKILKRKLERSDFKRERLETKIDKHDILARRLIEELDDAKGALIEINQDLEQRVKRRTQALRETNELLILEIKERTAVEQKLRNANDALIVARDGAEKASQEKSDFLANMSHELRTPLTAIIGFAELIAEELEEANLMGLHGDVGKVHIAAQHLLSVINDVLDLSKIEAGKARVERSTFSLPVLVREVVETIRPLAEQGNNVITYELGECPEHIIQDRNKLKQCLINLLGNAAKFTDQGEIRVEVDIQSADLLLIVRDTGIGIPQDRINAIFSAFTQADNSSTRDYGGTGLGLAITRHFCGLMGGEILVESTLGEGSIFTLRTPYEAPETNITTSEVEGSLLSSASGRVLVIDDDPDIHQLIAGFLGDLGIESESAYSGEKGLQLAKQINPTLITLDIMMSGISGWEVLNRLKGDPDTAQIPVAVISFVNEPERAQASGACCHMLKPVQRRNLAKLLSEYGVDASPSEVLR